MTEKDTFYTLMVASATKTEIAAIEQYNEKTTKYGLTLSDKDITDIVQYKYDVMQEFEIIDFNNNLIPAMIYEFCDSPYINQDKYKETIMTLQEIFYATKNEYNEEGIDKELMSDDELIQYMAEQFNTSCGGDLDELASKCFEMAMNKRHNFYKIVKNSPANKSQN